MRFRHLWELTEMRTYLFAALAASTVLASAPASAIIWTDWTASTATTVTGTVGGVGVTYAGDIQFVQLSGGIDYWNPFPTLDRPTGTDIIATTGAGLKTITFTQAVTDVYFAVNSWNGQSATFDKAFTIVAEGCGYWGCGTGTISNGGLTLTSPNEMHGILKFAGPITSLTYRDTQDENWHGLTIGIGSAVPEPASWLMMIGGLALVGASIRRRRMNVSFI